MDEERAEVRIIAVELLPDVGVGRVAAVELHALSLHPGDRLVTEAEPVAGDRGVVVGVEVAGVLAKVGGDARQSHLVIKRRVPLEPPGDHGDDLGQSPGLVGGGIAIPQAGGGGQGQSE